MPIIEGTTEVKSVTAAYDFAVDAGAVGDIVLRGTDSVGNYVPAGSRVVGGFVDVTTALTQSSGTCALKLEGAGDITAAVAVGTGFTTGLKDIVSDGTGDKVVKTTASRSVTLTVATAAVTAGKLTVTLLYI